MDRQSHTHDPELTRAIAAFIRHYRDAGGFPALMQQAVLAAFPAADGADFACGLVLANQIERLQAGWGCA